VWRRQRKDGSPIDIALSAAPLQGDGDTVVGAMAVLVDITEAKRSEQTLRESEAKYRAIFENIHDVFYQTELRGTIVELSPSVSQFGYSREQLIGTSVLNIYPDADERIAFVKALSAWRGERLRIRLKRGDGGVMAASVSARRGGRRRRHDRVRRHHQGHQRAQAIRIAARAGEHDPLTGLQPPPVRRELERHVSGQDTTFGRAVHGSGHLQRRERQPRPSCG
jgi:PAS domain S-box-containing protein